jgi:hypothetical protein
MSEFCRERRTGQRAATRRAPETASQDFSENDDWTKHLQRDRGGLLTNNLHNITLIMKNDPKPEGDCVQPLADGMEIKGDVPWKHPARFWRDADDAQLIS